MKIKAHTAILTIENCLDCPHSVQIRDPSSRDSFDFHDVSLCCRLTPSTTRTRTDLGEEVPGRFIVACERYVKREDAKVPEWCPLVKEKQ